MYSPPSMKGSVATPTKTPKGLMSISVEMRSLCLRQNVCHFPMQNIVSLLFCTFIKATKDIDPKEGELFVPPRLKGLWRIPKKTIDFYKEIKDKMNERMLGAIEYQRTLLEIILPVLKWKKRMTA